SQLTAAMRMRRSCSTPKLVLNGNLRRRGTSLSSILSILTVTLLSSAQSWIEDVAQAVSEEVHAQGGDEDHDAGDGHQQRQGEDVGPPLAEHPAPRRNRRGHAQAEEAEERFADDGASELDAGDDEDRRCHVGQHVLEDYPPRLH